MIGKGNFDLNDMQCENRYCKSEDPGLRDPSDENYIQSQIPLAAPLKGTQTAIFIQPQTMQKVPKAGNYGLVE